MRADDRFAVVDYKTNWLGAPGEELTAWHHRPAALATEMQHAHYALQALLYTVALHRYLRWRLPGYDPERNLAGVLYLFLRGMVGRDTPTVDGTPVRRLRLAPAERARRGAQRRARPGRRRVSLAENDPFDVRRATQRDRPAARLQRRRRARRRRRPRRAAAGGARRRRRRAGRAGRGARRARARASATSTSTSPPSARPRRSTPRRPSTSRRWPWPAVAPWTERLQASDLVAVGEEGGANRPLRLVGTSLYLDRYWREERQIAADLQALGAEAPADVDEDVLADGLARLFPGDADERQRAAGAAAVRHRFAVVAGGPGTGKTTTVARIVALLAEQAEAAGRPQPLIALAAPTASAAARLEEAVHDEAAESSTRATPSARSCAPRAPRPCTACSAGARTARAASATTAATGCPTTS